MEPQTVASYAHEQSLDSERTLSNEYGSDNGGDGDREEGSDCGEIGDREEGSDCGEFGDREKTSDNDREASGEEEWIPDTALSSKNGAT